MNCDVIGKAMNRSKLKLKWSHWRSLVLIAMLMCTVLVLAQQRDSMSEDERGDGEGGTVSSTQHVDESKVDESRDDTVDTRSNLANRIISILREDPEALSTLKEEIGQRTSVDPSTISDEAVYTRIRRDADLRAQIAQELSARGYELNDQGPSDSVRERSGPESEGARSDSVRERNGFEPEGRTF